jgi:hypothetical protein
MNTDQLNRLVIRFRDRLHLTPNSVQSIVRVTSVSVIGARKSIEQVRQNFPKIRQNSILTNN